jgi:hypothetical protein
MRNRFKVSLKLSRKSVNDLIGFGRAVHTHMDSNTFFGTPHPSLGSVDTALDELQTAMENAVNGGVTETAIQNAKRVIVQDLLTELGHYVEDTANESVNEGNEEVVITSAGMTVKGFTPAAPRVFTAKAGNLFGTIKLTAAFVKRGYHEWEYTATPGDPDSWIEALPTTKASTVIAGLTRGMLMSFRHRAITSDGPLDGEETTPVIVP